MDVDDGHGNNDNIAYFKYKMAPKKVNYIIFTMKETWIITVKRLQINTAANITTGNYIPKLK